MPGETTRSQGGQLRPVSVEAFDSCRWSGVAWAGYAYAGLRPQEAVRLRWGQSLLLHEGRSVIYVARQLGHDATLTLKTYGHVIGELEDQPQIPAEDAIRAAREKAAGDRRGSRASTVVAAPPLGGL